MKESFGILRQGRPLTCADGHDLRRPLADFEREMRVLVAKRDEQASPIDEGPPDRASPPALDDQE